jgi:hypothetical protein
MLQHSGHGAVGRQSALSFHLRLDASLKTRYPEDMPKRSSTPRDLNQLAACIVEQATADEPAPVEPMPEASAGDGKNPAAVALGRLGGKKGGAARAAALTPERRKEIAQKAAAKRWECAE